MHRPGFTRVHTDACKYLQRSLTQSIRFRFNDIILLFIQTRVEFLKANPTMFRVSASRASVCI